MANPSPSTPPGNDDEGTRPVAALLPVVGRDQRGAAPVFDHGPGGGLLDEIHRLLEQAQGAGVQPSPPGQAGDLLTVPVRSRQMALCVVGGGAEDGRDEHRRARRTMYLFDSCSAYQRMPSGVSR